MPPIEIRPYIDAAGRNAFQLWFESLENQVQARIITSLDRLQRGNFSGVKGVGRGLFEQRLDTGPGYRMYFGKDGEKLVILFTGGTKKRQEADIEAAQALWVEYKTRKQAARKSSAKSSLKP